MESNLGGQANGRDEEAPTIVLAGGLREGARSKIDQPLTLRLRQSVMMLLQSCHGR